MNYLLVFAAGFAGSFHCLGMCGGFACALGRDPRGGHGATMLRHLLYNSGRLTTYCFLGVLAGALGQIICTRQGATVTFARRLAERGRANTRHRRRTAHDRDGIAVLRHAPGVSSPCDRLRQQHLCHVLAQLADNPQPRGTARFWRVQRLPAVSAGLCLCGRSGEHRPSAARVPHYGVVRTGNLPCDADDGRRRAGSGAGVATARRVARRQLYPAARHYHARPWHPALRRTHGTWMVRSPSRL